MKDSILLELAKRWDQEAKSSGDQPVESSEAITNAMADGWRQGLRECADGLRTLVQLLGDKA